ncbi:MAG: hypothetical protein JRJ84_24300 [Deltaproteobacteria bacterium]|nr:hypothetical protein [Deltaproteobacteria bacterium]
MLVWLLLALIPAHAVTPMAGVAWTPFSRSDLVWTDDGRTSGVGVGEFDGAVRPALTGFGGAWISRRVGLVGTLGVARLQSTTWVGDTYRQRHWGVVRPGMDLRVALSTREVGRPAPWAMVGVHGDIPSARDVSNGYTDDEQDQADDTAFVDRARLGGVGGRVGIGVDYRLREGIAVGAMWAAEYHRGVLRTDEANTVSSWVGADAALLLTFEWPARSEEPESD